MKTILALLALLCTLNSHADDKLFKQHGQYKIFYSAFNSTFIDPDVAVANQIVRGKDKVSSILPLSAPPALACRQ